MASNKILTVALLAVGFASLSAGAQAQVALDNGASVSLSTSQTTGAGITMLNLGNAGASPNLTLVSQMPMSLTYGSVTVGISFTGTSGMYDGGGWAPTSSNYLIAQSGSGAVDISFSSAQKFFSTRWSSIDANNQFSFYNGTQLVASATGATAAGALANGSNFRFADFNFGEVGYDRVVVTAINGSLEFGAIGFSDQAVSVAPIPLNAASLGGLLSFLMMLGMRGKGGTQVAIRMAFASLMPRRRVVA